jgi:peptide-methionine (S)-S-oxide reductase
MFGKNVACSPAYPWTLNSLRRIYNKNTERLTRQLARRFVRSKSLELMDHRLRSRPVASRYLFMSVALTMCLAIASHAQENAAPGDTKSASPSDPLAQASATDSAATTDTGQSKTAAVKKADSPGDKKAASSAKTDSTYKTERATFGAGCFWHVEETFEHVKGVNWAVSGYAGGNIPNPSYEMVHEGFTGHAEVVMVDFDPEVISYEDLLNVFWKSHDPTTIDRQGPDEGPQYRSVIFYHSEEQRRAALKSYRALTARRAFRAPIVTQLEPLKAFYRAEDYHQDYYGGKSRANTRRTKSSSSLAKAKKAVGKTAKATTSAKAKAKLKAKAASADSEKSEPQEQP